MLSYVHNLLEILELGATRLKLTEADAVYKRGYGFYTAHRLIIQQALLWF